MVGQVTITAGINVAAAIYLIGAVTRIFGLPAETTVWGFALTDWYFQLGVMVLITVPQVLLNIFGIRVIALLNHLSVWWHIGGVLLIAGSLTLLGTHHNDLGFLLSTTTVVSPLDAASAALSEGGEAVPALVFGDVKLASPLFALFPALTELYRAAPFALVFLLATLQAQWTYTGYDASAHVAEETVMARKNSAWGVFLSVAVSSVVGYLMLIILTRAIPHGDVAATANDAYPVLYIVYNNLSPLLANVIAVIIGGAMWLCGAASITSMGRMWYAFARDDGMPGSWAVKRIHPTWKTPVWAILITTLLAVLLCVYAAAYFVITSISTIALYLAYVIPIYLSWRNRRRGQGEWAGPENAPWNLGSWSSLINMVAMGWVAVITVIFCLPPNELVLWSMLGFGATLGLYWLVYARTRFQGPVLAKEPEA